jgi:hypothetical protein
MKFVLSIFFLFLSVVLFAQTPGIPYQAVLLSQENAQELPGYDSEYANLLTNSIVSVRFSIYDVDGVEFKEVHSDVIVDAYGMINLIVGKGVYTYNDFWEMDWDGEEKWLKVEVDFENGYDFENLDYLPIHWIPQKDNQMLYIDGDSLFIENAGGVDLSDLLSSAGNDDQNITLVGNIIYLEDGGSIDLTDLLLANAGTDDQRLTLTGSLLNLEDGGTVDLSSIFANVADDNQNLTYINLNGTLLEVDIEDGDSVVTNLIGLASDSAFIADFVSNQQFIDAVQLNELDGDPNNEMNISFNVLGDFLRITDGGGVLSVPLSNIQIDTMGLSNRIDDIIFNDNDQDSTNELQSISLSNDTLYLSENGGAVDLSSLRMSEIEEITIANDGQGQFTTPVPITNPENVNVYRNGVKISFSIINLNTIEVEQEATCYQDDEIRIVQFY